ncbi:hypothetical protein M513_07429 [Trichuris suis]|uniref:EGF-like domain-containing protein n=1 Tax=Trichuris suis TaxID=68888 RepID=A0A085M3D6_9BILA|nr:hypothetical protein M513_07429 [Trichuris suis]
MMDSNVVHTGRTENATLLEQLSCSSNGQVDRNEKGEKMCKCPHQYTGIFCEIRVNGCLSEQCVNDGVCIEDETGYRCICKPGFNGQYCEKTGKLTRHCNSII